MVDIVPGRATILRQRSLVAETRNNIALIDLVD